MKRNMSSAFVHTMHCTAIILFVIVGTGANLTGYVNNGSTFFYISTASPTSRQNVTKDITRNHENNTSTVSQLTSNADDISLPNDITRGVLTQHDRSSTATTAPNVSLKTTETTTFFKFNGQSVGNKSGQLTTTALINNHSESALNVSFTPIVPTSLSSDVSTSFVVPTSNSAVPTSNSAVPTSNSAVSTPSIDSKSSPIIPTSSSVVPTLSPSVVPPSFVVPTSFSDVSTLNSAVRTPNSAVSGSNLAVPTLNLAVPTSNSTVPVSLVISTPSFVVPTSSPSFVPPSFVVPTSFSDVLASNSAVPTSNSAVPTSNSAVPTSSVGSKSSSVIPTSSSTVPIPSSSIVPTSFAVPTSFSDVTTPSSTVPTSFSTVSTSFSTVPTTFSTVPTLFSTVSTTFQSPSSTTAKLSSVTGTTAKSKRRRPSLIERLMLNSRTMAPGTGLQTNAPDADVVYDDSVPAFDIAEPPPIITSTRLSMPSFYEATPPAWLVKQMAATTEEERARVYEISIPLLDAGEGATTVGEEESGHLVDGVTQSGIPEEAHNAIIISAIIGGCAVSFFSVIMALCIWRQHKSRRPNYPAPSPMSPTTSMTSINSQKPVGLFQRIN